MKPRSTEAEHIGRGRQLQLIRDFLLKEAVDIGNKYPINSKARRLAQRACEAVDDLRCEMDSCMAQEMPDNFSPWVYYHGHLNHVGADLLEAHEGWKASKDPLR